ncbi:MAG: lipoyl synthase [Acidobacteriota bacterium]
MKEHSEHSGGLPIAGPRPAWLRVRLPQGETYLRLRRLVRRERLHTVCESASCPNIGECWSRGTATFMLLGNTCTRSCGFCDVRTGRPSPPDPHEPERVARAVRSLGLRYAVITSVNRDELEDGGAGHWAETVRWVRRLNPECAVEVLIPDFQGAFEALDRVLDAAPDVLSHNVETVPRLYRRVRPQADYGQSLAVLAHAAGRGFIAKSGLMLGLGERARELRTVLNDLHQHGCSVVTIGQYLRPSAAHLPVERYATPEEFESWRQEALELGLRHVESGPLVRSSYHADRLAPGLEPR